MATWINDSYVKVPEELSFAACVNEFIRDHWNDDDYTIHIKEHFIGNSFEIYDEIHKCSLIQHYDGKCTMSMKSVLAPTPLMGLFVKLCVSENQGSW